MISDEVFVFVSSTETKMTSSYQTVFFIIVKFSRILISTHFSILAFFERQKCGCGFNFNFNSNV